MDISTMVKTLLGMPEEDTSKDGLLSLYINIVTQRVLNYCNIYTLPEALIYTVAQLVSFMYRSEQISNGVIDVKGQVSSISEGSRTVSFGSNSQILGVAVPDSAVKEIKIELDKFKQLYKMNAPLKVEESPIEPTESEGEA